MSDPVKRMTTVALFKKDGTREIKLINQTLDPGNSFKAVVEMTIDWPNGDSGKFWKPSRSGRLFYKEI